MPLYVPVYPPEGGPPLQFVCLQPTTTESGRPAVCRKGTKSEGGMKVHLWRRHGVKLQRELFVEAPQAEQKPSPEKPHKRSKAGRRLEPASRSRRKKKATTDSF